MLGVCLRICVCGVQCSAKVHVYLEAFVYGVRSSAKDQLTVYGVRSSAKASAYLQTCAPLCNCIKKHSKMCLWRAQRGSAGVSMHQGRPEYVSRQYMCMCIWRVHSLDVRCSAGVSMCVAVQA